MLKRYLPLSPSRKAIASSSTLTAVSIGITGRASKTNAGSIEQNLWTAAGSSHSSNMYPPQSPTRMTLSGAALFKPVRIR